MTLTWEAVGVLGGLFALLATVLLFVVRSTVAQVVNGKLAKITTEIELLKSTHAAHEARMNILSHRIDSVLREVIKKLRLPGDFDFGA